MGTLIQRLALGGMFAMLGGVGISNAEAAHGKYCYQGTCHNFHGEAHIIHALSLMDEAVVAPCLQDRAQATVAAQREVMTAFREFCQYRAKHELIQAKVELARFIGSGDPIWLDNAASHLNAALVIEQQVHIQPAHTGHVHGSHGQQIVPVARPIAPRYEQSRYRGNRSRSYIRVGGPNFSFGFGF